MATRTAFNCPKVCSKVACLPDTSCIPDRSRHIPEDLRFAAGAFSLAQRRAYSPTQYDSRRSRHGLEPTPS